MVCEHAGKEMSKLVDKETMGELLIERMVVMPHKISLVEKLILMLVFLVLAGIMFFVIHWAIRLVCLFIVHWR